MIPLVRPSPRAPRSLRLLAPIASLLLVALCLGGCGRATSLPTSPASSRLVATRSGTMVTADPYVGTTVLWSASGSVDDDQVESEFGLTATGSVGPYRVCQVAPGGDPLAVSQAMLTDSRVSWAEPNYVAETAESRGHSFAFDDGHTDLAGYEDQTAAVRLGLGTAHTITTGSGVIVGVLDTGVNGNHPLLRGRVLPGWDFVSGDADPSELPDGVDSDGDGLVDEALGHGTHVAGIVALAAPGARILPLRVLDSDGHGDALSIARAIDYAADHGARVMNLSLGLLSEDHLIGDAINRASARGVLVVSSAGNWGAEEPEEFPAHFDATSAVAATRADDTPTTFTSFGSFVALCAPGEGIRSAFWNGNTAVWSGTSMSAPFVAGGAALLFALHPLWTPAQVMARLRATAHPLDPSVPEAATNFGSGRLDLAAAVLPDKKSGSGGSMPVIRAN